MAKGKTKNKIITLPRLIILALLLMLLLMGTWIFLRNTLVKGLITNIASLESQGYEISHGGLTVEGFPLSLNASSRDILVRAPISSMPDPTKSWSVKMDNVNVQSATVTPLSWDISHSGQMRIDMRGQAGERYMFDVTPADIEARAAVSARGTLKSARFDMARAQLDSLVGTPPVISKIEYLDGDIKVEDTIARITLHAEDLRLSPKIPSVLDNILGRKLALAELNANIDNWPLMEASGGDAWKAAGGRISSEHWAVLWGKADMTGSFDISFKNGKPEGKIQIRIKDPKPLINKITATGLIPAQYSSTINTLINLQETEDDGRKAVNLTIKSGTVKMGFITLFEF